MTIRGRILNLHPATLVLSSFLLVIVIGTFLLQLPLATEAGHMAWHDALFTATSAVCVTGLVVVDTGSFFTHKPTAFPEGIFKGFLELTLTLPPTLPVLTVGDTLLVQGPDQGLYPLLQDRLLLFLFPESALGFFNSLT